VVAMHAVYCAFKHGSISRWQGEKLQTKNSTKQTQQYKHSTDHSAQFLTRSIPLEAEIDNPAASSSNLLH